MATKQTTKTAAQDLQNLFDAQGVQDVFKTWGQTAERMTAITTEAASLSNDIARETAREAVSNLRDVSQVRDEPADYGKAYSDFAQKQMDLFMRTAQAFASVSQTTATEATELASKAGEEMGQKTALNVQGVANRVTSAASKAA